MVSNKAFKLGMIMFIIAMTPCVIADTTNVEVDVISTTTSSIPPFTALGTELGSGTASMMIPVIPALIIVILGLSIATIIVAMIRRQALSSL